jgi:hypothetical protein
VLFSTEYMYMNMLNQKFSYYSQEIDKIIDKQNRIVDLKQPPLEFLLKDESIVGLPVNKLYILSRSGHISKLNLSSMALGLKYHALPHTLNVIRNLEYSCKKFDSPDFPWVSNVETSFGIFALAKKTSALQYPLWKEVECS